MATHFYLTLPSNASMKWYPDNTLVHYITDLPQRIDLSGEWECGLAEIQYPQSGYNIGVYDTWFFLNETIPMGLTPSAKISVGYYKSPMTLMNHVNKGLNSMATDKVQAKLSYSSITQKITLLMTPGTEFTVPHRSALVRMLGFEPSVVSNPPSIVAAVPSALGSIISAVTTIADMTHTAENPILGGTDIGLTPLATVFLPPKRLPMARTPTVKRPNTWCRWIKGSMQSTSTRMSWSLAYVPLLYAHFKSIEMNIRDDTGRFVPFEYGNVTMTLHFRRRRTGLF